MFNLMDLASKYLDIDKLTAGMPSFSKSESSDGSYVLRKSRRKKKKPKNKKKIVIIKKKLQIPEPPKIIIVPQRVKRVKASKSAVAKNSSTSARNVKKPVKSHSEKSGKKDLDKKSNMPGQKGDTKKRSKKSNSLTVQKALKDFKRKKSQFLESLKLLQQHLSSVKAEDFLKNSKNHKNKERPKTRKDYQKSASESDVKVTKKTVQNEKIPKTVQNEKIQKTVPFRKEFSQFSSYDFFKCPPDVDTIEEAVAVFPYEVCQIGFLENPQVENETNENGTKVKFDDEIKFKMEENEKFDGNERLDSIVKSMKGMLPKCTVYRGRQ